ncbi:MAG: hypothetical protein ACE5K3_01065 [bacterium]
MSEKISDKKDSKQKVIAKAYQLGFEYEKEKHYCSQCVLATLQEVFQIRNDEVFQAAHGLAGGWVIARMVLAVLSREQLWQLAIYLDDPEKNSKKTFQVKGLLS